MKLTKEWISKRQTLLSFVFAFHVCQYMVITTVMSYGALYLMFLKEPNVSYTNQIMLCAMVVSGCFSSLIFGRIVDLTGNLKEITVGTEVVIIVSTILYIVAPESIVLVIGYGLFGLSDGLAVILRSELCKAYRKEMITTVHLIVRFGSVIGTALGCILGTIGIFAKIKVGSFTISGANFAIVISSVEFSAMILATCLVVTNLSTEYNFKKEEIEQDYRNNIDMELQNINFQENESLLDESEFFSKYDHKPRSINSSSMKVELALLFRCLPTFKVLCLSFLHGCISMSFERFLPLIGDNILYWQGMRMVFAYFFSCIPPLVAIILFWIKRPLLTDYDILLVGYIFIAASGLMSGVLGIFVNKSVYGFILFSFILSTHKLSWAFQDAVTASLFSKMIPSQSQCICEAVRYFVTSCGMCIGAFLTGIAYHTMITYCSLLLFICILSFYFLRSESEAYKNPGLLWLVAKENSNLGTLSS